MKTKLSSLQFSLMLLCALNLQPSTARAQGTAFTYQGWLNDGSNPASGMYDLRFAIYDASGGAGVVAGPVTNSPVAVSNGLFTVTLDFGAGVFTGAERWLDIGVRTNGGGAFTALSPRQKLTPTPYAIHAGGAQAATTVAPGGVNSAALAAGSVGSPAIADGSIATSDLSLGLLNNTFWRLGGNAGTTPGTHFLGTTDNQPLELRVSGLRGLRIEPDYISPSLIGGSPGNFIAAGIAGAVIAGGGYGDATNSIESYLATISGGNGNRIRPNAVSSVISGGYANEVSAGVEAGVIAGGELNVIGSNSTYGVIGGGVFGNIGSDASHATIGGGSQNQISMNSAKSTIGGGGANGIGANSIASTISGGVANNVAADSSYATIAGGIGNFIRSSSSISAIGGGMFNGIWNQNTNATIGGGYDNAIWQDSSYSTIAGGENNDIYTTSPHSAIAGGQNNVIGLNSHHSVINGGENNDIGPDAWHSVISGGYGNTVEDDSFLSTIGGGNVNAIGANSASSTIGGGWQNSVVGFYATIPGGILNHVAGNVAFAAGRYAHALHDHSFVWSSRYSPAPSFSAHRFHVHASEGLSVDYAGQRGDGGGERWIVLGGLSDFPGQTISTWTGARLTDGGVWADNSDRNTKENLTPVNPIEILERVAALPVQDWNYKVEGPEVRHIGPMAQDFHAAFGTGHDDKHLAALDSAGVALAAIQGLNQKLEAENAGLKQRLSQLEELVRKLAARQNSHVQ